MERVALGKTGLEVTRAGFGVLTVGRTQLKLSLEEGADVLRYALDRGINFLDTAQYYETYPYIKKALKGFAGDVIICSKSLDVTHRGMSMAIEQARKEMDRDVIDLFLLHEVRHDGDLGSRRGAWESLLEARSRGRVRAIGLSTHHVDVAEEAAVLPGCDVLFPLINFRGLGIRKGAGPGTREEMAEAIRKADERGLGVFGMKAFGGGNLTGSYREALDYVYGLPGLRVNMIGFGNRREVDDIVDYLEGRLPAGYAPDIHLKRIRIDQGDCEGCHTCVTRCPNQAIFVNENGLADICHGKCLTCGYCAPVCPVRAIIMF